MLWFMSSIVVGVSALVAISSFGESLETAIDRQARTLLGADLAIFGNQPFTDQAQKLINTIQGERSRQVSFLSMAHFPESEKSRLVRVRAIEGGFPYYGTLETEPAAAAHHFQSGPGALADDALMLQFGAGVGDPVQLGSFIFHIAGRLKSTPGEAAVRSLIGPTVFIPLEYLDQTGLIQFGSRARYTVYLKMGEGADVETLVRKIEPDLIRSRLAADTVEKRKARLGRTIGHFGSFLKLVAFAALLLGGIGVASSIHLYVKQKTAIVAMLRCLGASSGQTVLVYLIQAAALGLLGSILGALFGLGVQAFLPLVLRDFLPLEVPFIVSGKALAEGLLLGFGIVLLIALLPLLPIRKMSPLLALRSDYEQDVSQRKDPLRWLVYFLLGGAIFSFAITQTGQWVRGAAFFVSLVLIFGLLSGVAKLIMLLVRRWFPSSWPYVWRQGLANLYRPLNQTTLLMLSLGLGTFLILTLYLTHHVLLDKVSRSSRNQPNLLLFDIQSDQKPEVSELLRSLNVPVLHDVPIVTVRLSSIKGRSVEQVRRESPTSEWALLREYRCTYRNRLVETEEIVEGSWQGRVNDSATVVPVSLEEGIAENLKVSVGDTLEFDVQGVPMMARVASIRRVDWDQLRTNFFILFPEGVLENAPQFHVVAARVPSRPLLAKLQRAIMQRFPSVSSIDLALILDTMNAVLDKVSFVIRFMASFSVITGLMVLAAAVATGRYQRLRESVLLRTLGASRAQILKILMVEYLLLGAFAAATGGILALAATGCLAYFVFDSVFVPSPAPVVIAFFIVTALTLAIGLLNSRGVCDKAPLETLQASQ